MDDAMCVWSIDCDTEIVSLVFTILDTEAVYDFVNVFDSATADYGHEMAELSGQLEDQDTVEFVATGPHMTLQFTSDESLGGSGFEASYVCGDGSSVVEAAQGQAEVVATYVNTDGTPVTVNIEVPGEQVWFEFTATAGNTYEIGTDLLGIADTVMHLYDGDGETQIAENDDRGAERSSYLEWTCPADGAYRVLVHGYDRSQTGDFRFRVMQATGVEGGCNPETGEGCDPCHDTAVIQAHLLTVGHAVINFIGNPNYEADAFCDWKIQCQEGPVSITFGQLDTETDYDTVTLFSCQDASCETKDEVSVLSGRLADLSQTTFDTTGTGNAPTLLLEFESDESIGGAGFEASYSCGETSTERTYAPVPTDGTPVAAEVTTEGQQVWFSFDAEMGTNYGIATELTGLDDSVMHLYGLDGEVQLAENDDAAGDTRMSYLEWSCPESGTYYVMVHAYDTAARGTFNVLITGGGDGDPCEIGGATMDQESAVIRYMPDSGADNDALCEWHIHCPSGAVSVTFTHLDTEADCKLAHPPSPSLWGLLSLCCRCRR